LAIFVWLEATCNCTQCQQRDYHDEAPNQGFCRAGGY
jgi:hypothetical protein